MASIEAPAFVMAGRQAQFETLDTALVHALTGPSQVILVAGDAGTGKTTLIREFSRRAQEANDQLIVAYGQSSAPDADPYLPFKEITVLLTGDVDGAQAKRVLNEVNGRRLKRAGVTFMEIMVEVGGDLVGVLMPGAALLARVVSLGLKALKIGWVNQLEKQVEHPPSREGFKPEQIFEQFSRVLMEFAAKNSLLLVLDDLHWADSGTLDLFFYLTRRMQQASHLPLMLVGMYRPTEIRLGRDGTRHPLERIINEVRRYWGDAEIDLEETVGGAAGRAFVNSLIDTEPNRLDAAFRELLFRRTDGHPLFTVELLRTLEERGVLVKDEGGQWVVGQPVTFEELPDKIEAVIEERISRLEKSLKDILTCGSVEGEQFTAEIVARVRKIEELQLAEDLSEELKNRYSLVVPAGEAQTSQKRLHIYRFLHVLFQQYLYDNLSAMQRQLLHRAVGEALEALYGDDVDQVAAQLARHFDEAFEDEKAIRYLLLAGDRAKAAYANADAIRAFVHARAVIARGQIGRQEQEYQIAQSLVQVYALQGQVPEQQAEIDRMLRLARTLSDQGKLADGYTWQAKFYTQVGDYAQAKQAGVNALNVAQQLGDELRAADAKAAIGEACAFRAEHDEALSHLSAALETYRKQGDKHRQAEALRLQALVYLNRNDYPEALERAQHALGLFREIGDRLGEDETLRYLGDIYCGRGDYQQGLDCYQQVLQIRREIGNRARVGGALGDIGDVYLFLGRYRESLALHRQSLAIDSEVGYKYGQTWAHHDLGVIQLNLSNLAMARAELEQALALALEIQAPNLILLSKNDLSRVFRALGGEENLRRAWQLAHEACELGEQASLVFGTIAGRSYQALAELGLGQPAEAAKDSLAAVQLLEAHGAAEISPEEIFFNHYLVLQAAGEIDKARDYLQKAYDEMTAKANKIQDPALRESFLGRVPINREIGAAWAGTAR